MNRTSSCSKGLVNRRSLLNPNYLTLCNIA